MAIQWNIWYNMGITMEERGIMLKKMRAIVVTAIVSIVLLQPLNLISTDLLGNPLVQTVEASSKNQKISGGTYTKTFNKNEVKKASKSFSIGAKATAGKLTYKKMSGSSKVSVSSTGKVTVKKGTSVGTYSVKVKISTEKLSKYKSTSITKTVVVKIKKSSEETTSTSGAGSVWISATGKKYHSMNHCGRMNPAKATKMTEKQAKKRGYSRCSKCY